MLTPTFETLRAPTAMDGLVARGVLGRVDGESADWRIVGLAVRGAVWVVSTATGSTLRAGV